MFLSNQDLIKTTQSNQKSQYHAVHLTAEKKLALNAKFLYFYTIIRDKLLPFFGISSSLTIEEVEIGLSSNKVYLSMNDLIENQPKLLLLFR